MTLNHTAITQTKNCKFLSWSMQNTYIKILKEKEMQITERKIKAMSE